MGLGKLCPGWHPVRGRRALLGLLICAGIMAQPWVAAAQAIGKGHAAPAAPPESVSAESAMDSVPLPPPAPGDNLAELRMAFMQNQRAIHQLEFQLQQSGRAAEVKAEMAALRQEIGRLHLQAQEFPELAEEMAPQLQELRSKLKAAGEERTALLNESTEYRELQDQKEALLAEIKTAMTSPGRESAESPMDEESE